MTTTANLAETRAERATEYASKWGGTLVEQSDGDWLVIGAITSLGTPMTVRFTPSGLNKVEIPAGPLSKTPAPANDNDPLPVINPAEWQDAPIPQRLWYLRDLIPHRQVTILNGDGGVGKSLLSLQIAAAGAMQCETLDMRPMPGRVLYVGAEDEADEFHRRLVDIVAAHQRELSDLVDFRLLSLADSDALLAVPDKAGVMQPTPLWEKLEKLAEQFNPVLVVLDTAADLYGGDEIKRGQVRQFISMLRHLAMRIDCAIVLLAHPSLQGMQSGSGSSGSTAWGNSVRSRLYLTSAAEKDADPDLRILTTKKANYGKAGGELRMRWQEGAFVRDDGKPSAAAGILHAHHNRTFLRLLSDINRSGERVSSSRSSTYAPTVMRDMPGADGASKKDLESAMRRLLSDGSIKVVTEGPPSRQRQRLIVSAEDFGPS